MYAWGYNQFTDAEAREEWVDSLDAPLPGAARKPRQLAMAASEDDDSGFMQAMATLAEVT